MGFGLSGTARLRTAAIGLAATAALGAGAFAVLDRPARSSGRPSAPTTKITLTAARSTVAYGRSVRLSGSVSGSPSAATVTIVDDVGEVVARPSVSSGAFHARVSPEAGTSFTAESGAVASAPVDVAVQAVTSIKLASIDILKGARVAGAAKPAGAAALVSLTKGGRSIAQDSVAVGPSGKFKTTFEITAPGRYRAKVTYEAPGVGPDSATSNTLEAGFPVLTVGSGGSYVASLEQALADLDYYFVGIDDSFDESTADAVRAFTKVQGLTPSGEVDAAVWKALETPKTPRARSHEAGYHVEVDQTRQVMFLVEDGDITDIVHVSTGAGGATLDGSFQIYKKGGLGRQYYPSYFDGARAFHIWPEVPTYAASHGCVRLPFWTAEWYWDHTPVGTDILIYH